MLQKKDSKTYEVKVFHEPDFEGWMKELSAGDYREIIVHLDKIINDNTTFDTGQLKGHDWAGKVMAPLLEVTENNEGAAQEFLEMILMDYLIRRPDKTWSYHRQNRDQLGQHEKQEIVFEVTAVTPA